MDREQEEAVLRITARYVEEVQAGHQPNVSDYLARYPQYAGEIADFVAYYQAIEVDVPYEANMMPALSEKFHIAIDSAWERIVQAESGSTTKLTTLLITESKQRLTLSRLAKKIGLTVDIVTKLEQRKIKASSIPRELLNRLAEVLQHPLSAIQAYFESLREPASNQHQVAEAQSVYQMEEQSQSFRKAIEESVQLSGEKKRAWIEILKQEGL